MEKVHEISPKTLAVVGEEIKGDFLRELSNMRKRMIMKQPGVPKR